MQLRASFSRVGRHFTFPLRYTLGLIMGTPADGINRAVERKKENKEEKRHKKPSFFMSTKKERKRRTG